VAGIFLALASYGRKESVTGYLTPVSGIARVMPGAAGTVAEVYVPEGDTVAAGQKLLMVRTGRRDTESQAVDTAVVQQAEARRAAVTERIGIEQRRAAQERQALTGAISGLEDEVTRLNEALQTQRARVKVAHDQTESVRSTVAQGFTSVTEFRRRQDAELAQRQAETELYRQISVKAVEVRTKRYALSEAEAKAADTLAALRGSLTDAEAALAEAQGRQGYVVTAPMVGRVTSLQAWAGMSTEAGVPFMAIVPENAPLQALLLVPARAIGFIAPGQVVQVAFDAFPFQRFGLHAGRIESVSKALLKPTESAGPLTPKEPSYRVTAWLERQTVTAYGREVPLRPDMSLRADIIIDRRSLIQWLFDPLLSARGRV
ncbi:MAG TPA: HlyD family efflux transporter periplasmic adaptor subunit, partial [Rhodopila sp.]|nr:HlyD family efflux transporter periplasmic adaptor subunit [Rhodopila sp.]